MPAIFISVTIPSFVHRLSFSLPSSNSYPQHQLFSALQWRRRRRREIPVIALSGKFFAELPVSEEEWIKKLPDKTKPLYSHSLPCIESWLRSLGFYQSRDDRANWIVEKDEWHAQLSLDVTDIYIRYLKSGPGNLEKDVERRFSYALSREDIENAVLGGP